MPVLKIYQKTKEVNVVIYQSKNRYGKYIYDWEYDSKEVSQKLICKIPVDKTMLAHMQEKVYKDSTIIFDKDGIVYGNIKSISPSIEPNTYIAFLEDNTTYLNQIPIEEIQSKIESINSLEYSESDVERIISDKRFQMSLEIEKKIMDIIDEVIPKGLYFGKIDTIKQKIFNRIAAEI